MNETLGWILLFGPPIIAYGSIMCLVFGFALRILRKIGGE